MLKQGNSFANNFDNINTRLFYELYEETFINLNAYIYICLKYFSFIYNIIEIFYIFIHLFCTK